MASGTTERTNKGSAPQTHTHLCVSGEPLRPAHRNCYIIRLQGFLWHMFKPFHSSTGVFTGWVFPSLYISSSALYSIFHNRTVWVVRPWRYFNIAIAKLLHNPYIWGNMQPKQRHPNFIRSVTTQSLQSPSGSVSHGEIGILFLQLWFDTLLLQVALTHTHISGAYDNILAWKDGDDS